MLQLAARRRFLRVDRSTPAQARRTCRGMELQGGRLAAHLAVLGTFPDLNNAKAVIAVTVGGFFGDGCWRSREAEGLILAHRLLSEGAGALKDTVNTSLDAWGTADETRLVFQGMGQTLVDAGLAQVKDGVLVDGPRIEAARATLRDQRYSENSEAMESATIEHILLTWLNFALSDPVLKERIPDFVWAHGELAPLLRSQGARVYDLAIEPRSSAIFHGNGSITLSTDSRTILVLSDGYDRPDGKPPGWLHCFSGKARAVKESYVRALADAGFDFDRVPLGPHLAYEPGTTRPRAL